MSSATSALIAMKISHPKSPPPHPVTPLTGSVHNFLLNSAAKAKAKLLVDPVSRRVKNFNTVISSDTKRHEERQTAKIRMVRKDQSKQKPIKEIYLNGNVERQ